MKLTLSQKKRGITLVEVLVASSIILAAVVTLLSVHNLFLRSAFTSANAMKAAYLAEEAVEALRYMRDQSWDENIGSLSIGVPYGIVFSNNSWQATTTAFWLENFERVVTLGTVYRNASGDIVLSGGVIDPGTVSVISTVSWWNGAATTTKSLSTYLSNFYEN